MYGQIHLCIRSLVLAKFGEEKWNEIVTHSGLDVVDDFLTFQRYEDSKTIGLVVSVTEVLGVTLETVLELFGEYFFIYCYQNGYDKMLRTLGDDFKTFIQNLDSLHSLLALSYKDINAPSFRVEIPEEGQMILHYYSCRNGLHHIVIGLCRSVGREMFNQDVTLEVLDKTEIQFKGKPEIYHVAFNVTCKGRSGSLTGMELDIDLQNANNKRTENAKHGFCVAEKSMISPNEFCQLFPFHVLFDKELLIKQTGTQVLRWCQMRKANNLKLDQIFNLTKPKMTLNFENITKFQNANFVLESRDKKGDVLIRLRGQMVPLHNQTHMLFIGSPRLASLDELQERNMFLSDIPMFDVTRELVLLNQQRLAEVEVSKKLDETTAELKKTALALDIERGKTEMLLNQMLPKKVAAALKEGHRVDAEKFADCTILFSDVVTFTNIAAAVTPIQIVNMLNALYTKFDDLTEKHNVYKVETIGDAYMIVAGVPETSETHAQNVADFSLDMVAAARTIMSPATGKPIQIRVGFHSGPVVAGVVGDKMPRYCLFGDTVNTSSRMESHGLPGKIHMSPSAYDRLKKCSKFVLESRGVIEVKGKGAMETRWLLGLADGSKWNMEFDDKGEPIHTEMYHKYVSGNGSAQTAGEAPTNGDVSLVPDVRKDDTKPAKTTTRACAIL